MGELGGVAWFLSQKRGIEDFIGVSFGKNLVMGCTKGLLQGRNC